LSLHSVGTQFICKSLFNKSIIGTHFNGKTFGRFEALAFIEWRFLGRRSAALYFYVGVVLYIEIYIRFKHAPQ
jgi:hypothetical protein